MERPHYALTELSGTLFSSCLADDAEESDALYFYTAEQRQEIENLKECYGD